MRYVVALAAFAVAMVLAFLSLPWLVCAIGFGASGDDAQFDRMMDAAPLTRWLDWVDAR